MPAEPNAATIEAAAPGSWRLLFTDDERPSPFVATEGDVVCVADPNHRQPDVFDNHNMRLIAAAPEMLACLIEMTKQVEGCAANHYGDNPEGGSFPHIERAHAVIAKATAPILRKIVPSRPASQSSSEFVS